MRKLVLLLFAILGGLVVAVHLSHWLLPMTNPLVAVEVKDGWLTTSTASSRGYFRQTLELPFVPKHAWIAVAADDYILYVNGQPVGHNMHLLIHGDTFQGRLSDRSQSLTYGREFLSLVWEPVLQRAPHEERSMVQYFCIQSLLKQGRNSIALFVQSPQRNRAAVWGAATAPGKFLEIPGYAAAWKASVQSSTREGRYWYDPAYGDVDWTRAVPAERGDDAIVHAAQPPEIWTKPFTTTPMTVDRAAEEHIFQLPLPQEPAASGGWIRLWSNRPYDVFVGNYWAGADVASSGAMGLDISRFLPDRPPFLSVRLHRLTNLMGKLDAKDEMPWLAVDGSIGGTEISTPNEWRVLQEFHPDWRQGAGKWQTVNQREISRTPQSVRLASPNIWERGWFLMLAKLTAVCALLLAALAGVLGTLVPMRREGRFQRHRLELGFWILTPALLGILVLELVRYGFSVSDNILWFLMPASEWLLLTGPVIVLATVLLLMLPSWKDSSDRSQEGDFQRGAFSRGTCFALAGICVLGFVLRAYALDFQPPIADELTSWDAANGIQRTGVPVLRGGVMYTRSPLYHYALAGWLTLFGDSLASGRSLSILVGVLVLPGLYYLLYSLTARRRAGALLGTLIFALDPWMIATTRLMRFYPLMQLFMVLSVIFFLKAFIWREGKKYQNLFFLTCTLGVMSQELFAATFPAFLLAFLACYRPFSWKLDWNVWIGFVAMMTLTLLDVFTFSFLCLTPHVAVATHSESLIVLHFSDINGAQHANMITRIPTSLFYTCNGHNLLLSAAFFLGLLYWARHPNRAVFFLYWSLFVTLASVTVLDVMMSARYIFFLYPIFFTLSFMSAVALVEWCGAWLLRAEGKPEFQLRRRWRFVALSVLLAGCVANLDLAKVISSYDRLRVIDQREAVAEVSRRQRPSDIVINSRPQVASPDYLLMGGLRLIGYLQPTKTGVVERSAGGKMMWTVDQLREVLAKSPRAWVIIDDEYQGYLQAGVLDFLLQSCTVEYEYFGGRVLLWDRVAGRIPRYPEAGGQANDL